MFTNKICFRPLAFLVVPSLALGLWLAESANAQVQVEVPDLPAFPELPMRGGMGAIMDFDMTTMTGGTNRSMSVTIENGVRKMTITENGQKTSIHTDEEGKITMKVTKKYTPDNMDELMDEHPTLYMNLKGFPEEDEGAEVEINLNVTKKYEADSEEDLKEKHPEIHKIFKKYNQPGNVEFGGMPEGFRMLRGLRGGSIRVVPDGIILDDIKIHEDEDTKKDSDRKESSSKDKDKDT